MSCMKKNSKSKLALVAACGIVSGLVGCGGGPGAQSPSVDSDGGAASTSKDPVSKEGPMKEPGGAEKSSCGGGGHSH